MKLVYKTVVQLLAHLVHLQIIEFYQILILVLLRLVALAHANLCFMIMGILPVIVAIIHGSFYFLLLIFSYQCSGSDENECTSCSSVSTDHRLPVSDNKCLCENGYYD